jgi:hypothetical protein
MAVRRARCHLRRDRLFLKQDLGEIVSREDPLAPIDEIEQHWVDGERHRVAEAEDVASTRTKFSAEFTRRFEDEVRPAMDAILVRLRADGGGGVIIERPADETRRFAHRFTLWMSLLGEIDPAPRADRHPYLQLDADPDSRRVEIWEGDLWRGRAGGMSGKVAVWTLRDMNGPHVEREAIDILRRSTAVAVESA